MRSPAQRRTEGGSNREAVRRDITNREKSSMNTLWEKSDEWPRILLAFAALAIVCGPVGAAEGVGDVPRRASTAPAATASASEVYAPIQDSNDNGEVAEIDMFVGESRVFPSPGVARIAVGSGSLLAASVLDHKEVILFVPMRQALPLCSSGTPRAAISASRSASRQSTHRTMRAKSRPSCRRFPTPALPWWEATSSSTETTSRCRPRQDRHPREAVSADRQFHQPREFGSGWCRSTSRSSNSQSPSWKRSA